MGGARGRDIGAVEPARLVVWALALAAVGAAAWLWLAEGSRGSPEPVASAVASGAPGTEDAPAPGEGAAAPTATAIVTATVAPTPTASASPTTEPPASEPTPAVGGSATALPSASPSVEPAPPGQTVLFRGGPATGPWQQIGSVAEITHPEADPRAATSYREFWSDPEEENQPDWLWDQIVAEVAAEAVTLGSPLDRPFAGGAPDTQAYNSFGGIQEIDFEQNRFSAGWTAGYTSPTGEVAQAHWFYLISFQSTVQAQDGPFIFLENDAEDFREMTVLVEEALNGWVEALVLPEATS